MAGLDVAGQAFGEHHDESKRIDAGHFDHRLGAGGGARPCECAGVQHALGDASGERRSHGGETSERLESGDFGACSLGLGLRPRDVGLSDPFARRRDVDVRLCDRSAFLRAQALATLAFQRCELLLFGAARERGAGDVELSLGALDVRAHLGDRDLRDDVARLHRVSDIDRDLLQVPGHLRVELRAFESLEAAGQGELVVKVDGLGTGRNNPGLACRGGRRGTRGGGLACDRHQDDE